MDDFKKWSLGYTEDIKRQLKDIIQKKLESDFGMTQGVVIGLENMGLVLNIQDLRDKYEEISSQ